MGFTNNSSPHSSSLWSNVPVKKQLFPSSDIWGETWHLVFDWIKPFKWPSLKGFLISYLPKLIFYTHIYSGTMAQCISVHLVLWRTWVLYPAQSQTFFFQFLTRFSTKILVIRLGNKGRAGGRILNGVKLRFPLNNFSLLWPIDTKLAVRVAYIKRQLGIATQVSVIKVKVTVTKNRNSVSDKKLLWPIDTKLAVWVAYIKTQLGIATVRPQYNDTVGSKNICQHIEFSSKLNFIIHHVMTYLFTVVCTLCFVYTCIIIMFYVYFIINMTYDTHNRTT